MGTKSSSPISDEIMQSWQRTGKVNNNGKQWVNKLDNNKKLQQYQIFANDQNQFDEEKRMFSFRENHPQLVSAEHFIQKTNKEFCSSSYKADLFLERVPILLSDVRDIPFPDALHIYHNSLEGFHELFKVAGNFNIQEDQIGLNQQAVAKVWLDPVFYKSYPSSKLASQDEMVRKIINIIQINVAVGSIPHGQPLPGNYIQSNTTNTPLRFEQAKQKLRDYVNIYNNGKIPTSLQFIEFIGGVSHVNDCINDPQQKKQILKSMDQKNSPRQYKQVNHSTSIIGDKSNKVIDPPPLHTVTYNEKISKYMPMPATSQTYLPTIPEEPRIQQHPIEHNLPIIFQKNIQSSQPIQSSLPIQPNQPIISTLPIKSSQPIKSNQLIKSNQPISPTPQIKSVKPISPRIKFSTENNPTVGTKTIINTKNSQINNKSINQNILIRNSSPQNRSLIIINNKQPINIPSEMNRKSSIINDLKQQQINRTPIIINAPQSHKVAFNHKISDSKPFPIKVQKVSQPQFQPAQIQIQIQPKMGNNIKKSEQTVQQKVSIQQQIQQKKIRQLQQPKLQQIKQQVKSQQTQQIKQINHLPQGQQIIKGQSIQQIQHEQSMQGQGQQIIKGQSIQQIQHEQSMQGQGQQIMKGKSIQQIQHEQSMQGQGQQIMKGQSIQQIQHEQSMQGQGQQIMKAQSIQQIQHEQSMQGQGQQIIKGQSIQRIKQEQSTQGQQGQQYKQILQGQQIKQNGQKKQQVQVSQKINRLQNESFESHQQRLQQQLTMTQQRQGTKQQIHNRTKITQQEVRTAQMQSQRVISQAYNVQSNPVEVIGLQNQNFQNQPSSRPSTIPPEILTNQSMSSFTMSQLPPKTTDMDQPFFQVRQQSIHNSTRNFYNNYMNKSGDDSQLEWNNQIKNQNILKKGDKIINQPMYQTSNQLQKDQKNKMEAISFASMQANDGTSSAELLKNLRSIPASSLHTTANFANYNSFRAQDDGTYGVPTYGAQSYQLRDSVNGYNYKLKETIEYFPKYTTTSKYEEKRDQTQEQNNLNINQTSLPINKEVIPNEQNFINSISSNIDMKHSQLVVQTNNKTDEINYQVDWDPEILADMQAIKGKLT